MEANQKKTVIVAVVAAVLAVLLCVIWIQKGSLVKELQAEKAELTEQITALQNDYASLTSDYDSLNVALAASREECAQLAEKVKTTEATDRAKIRRYERELRNMRAQLKKYAAQIDELNAANALLTQERDAARQEAAANQEKVVSLTATVEDLESKLEAGSILKARDLKVIGTNAKGKKKVRAKQVVRVVTSLALIENDLAAKGPVTVYVRVLDANGNLVVSGAAIDFKCAGNDLQASASREVDYEGSEVELSVYLTDIKLVAGVYTVEAYTEKSQLGTVELALR